MAQQTKTSEAGHDKKAENFCINNLIFLCLPLYDIALGRLINMNKLVEKSTREFFHSLPSGSFCATVNLHGTI